MNKAIEAFEQNRRLGRGVNIIGYDPIWTSRADGRFQADHFRKIREAGFNHVRVNLHPFKVMGDAPEYRIPEEWFATLDWVVDECLKNELLVILDMHEFNAMAADPMGLKPMFLAVWKQLSAHCKGLPETVLFELLNEPNGLITVDLWNEYLVEPLAIIRANHPNRTVIIGPAFWNGIDYLHKLVLPEDDRNLIVTVHYYHPMPFTHQGAPWSLENKDVSGIQYLASPEEIQSMRKDFDNVQAWASANNRPIYLGEFGAYEKADLASRVRYTETVAREAEKQGWGWGYWQFDSDFIVYDIDRDAWVEPILRALIP